MSTWILGQFDNTDALLTAARRLREAGVTGLDTHTPYPVHGIEDALGLKKSVVPIIALTGGITGVVTAFVMQYYPSAIDYPINVGNRLAFSPPAFVPIMFELGILLCGLSIFGSLIGPLFGFPRPHHPVFEVDAFRSASSDKFWVSVEAVSAENQGRVEELLRSNGASLVAVHKEPEE